MAEPGETLHDIDERIAGFLRSRWDLPGEPFINQVCIVASYLNEDGEHRWTAHTLGDGGTSTMIGLLEYAKFWLIHHTFSEQPDDEET